MEKMKPDLGTFRESINQEPYRISCITHSRFGSRKRMPDFGLSCMEADDLVVYLLMRKLDAQPFEQSKLLLKRECIVQEPIALLASPLDGGAQHNMAMPL